MSNGKPLVVSDVMLTCGLEGGQRVLRVCRPRCRLLASEQVRAMQLAFDAASLCPPGKDSRKPAGAARNKRVVLVVVPLRENISDRDATATGRRVVEDVFRLFAAESARTSTNAAPLPPHRVYAPARSTGPVGAIA